MSPSIRNRELPSNIEICPRDWSSPAAYIGNELGGSGWQGRLKVSPFSKSCERHLHGSLGDGGFSRPSARISGGQIQFELSVQMNLLSPSTSNKSLAVASPLFL